jgi:PAP2 superfamily
MVRKGTPANIAYRALSALDIAIDEAMVAAWDSKYAYARPHPSTLDPELWTAIPIPTGPSYPAAHAVAAGAAAAVLEYLYPKQAEAFRAMSEEAATSRLLAGVAYPSDVAAGLELGRRVAAKVVERAAADGSDAPWTGTVPVGPGLPEGISLRNSFSRAHRWALSGALSGPVLVSSLWLLSPLSKSGGPYWIRRSLCSHLRSEVRSACCRVFIHHLALRGTGGSVPTLMLTREW